MVGPAYMHPETARALLALSRQRREASMLRRTVRAQIELAFDQCRNIGFAPRAAFELAHIHVNGCIPEVNQ